MIIVIRISMKLLLMRIDSSKLIRMNFWIFLTGNGIFKRASILNPKNLEFRTIQFYYNIYTIYIFKIATRLKIIVKIMEKIKLFRVILLWVSETVKYEISFAQETWISSFKNCKKKYCKLRIRQYDKTRFIWKIWFFPF